MPREALFLGRTHTPARCYRTLLSSAPFLELREKRVQGWPEPQGTHVSNRFLNSLYHRGFLTSKGGKKKRKKSPSLQPFTRCKFYDTHEGMCIYTIKKKHLTAMHCRAAPEQRGCAVPASPALPKPNRIQELPRPLPRSSLSPSTPGRLNFCLILCFLLFI